MRLVRLARAAALPRRGPIYAPAAFDQSRLFSSKSSSKKNASEDSKSFSLPLEYKTHLCDGPQATESVSTKEELLDYHRLMYTIRRMEITCDTEYKARNIRGFCHLYDGQEAVAVGIQAALSKDDDVTSAYRCHGLQYVRGDKPSRIFGELFGKKNGASKGKGGSMHLYSKANRFWGGSGIVGAQVPVGTGIGFANKYKCKGKWPSTVSVVMFGDGASNQGQVYEAANMARLWDLPVIYLIENNQYGMGTSTQRSSANPEYHKMGGVVTPGVQCDGMDVLAVKECMAWAKDWVGNGKGPLFVEMKTYRYHGHSMSDPGLSYRDRTEVQEMRSTRDCIELVKKRLIESNWSTEQELKQTEKEIRNYISDELKLAKSWDLPEEEHMYSDIYYKEEPEFTRGVEITTSRDLRKN